MAKPKMRIANFVERPRDEFNNRGYTPGKAFVIKCKVEPGGGESGTLGSAATLHILEPEEIKRVWPTFSALYWLEVSEPVGPISNERWLDLCKDKNLLNSLTTG